MDPEKQILDPLQELKKEAAVLGDKTQDAKLYSNEQFRPDMLKGMGLSGNALMEFVFCFVLFYFSFYF